MDEQFPDGFDCEGCYLNGVSHLGRGPHRAVRGLRRTRASTPPSMGVEGITGLKINYWAMVNLRGLQATSSTRSAASTLNVRDRIPVGLPRDDVTDYIEPGMRKLNGFETLWFARVPRGLRRLLADGAAEVRDERDAPADQPADGAAQLREDRQAPARR